MRSKTRLTAMLKRLSSALATSSSGMPSMSSTSARELTTSNRRGTMLTLTPLSAQARTMRRKSLWRARENATITRSMRSSADDRVEVVQGADHRQRRTLVAVVPRLAVVEEPDEVDAVLGVAGDLGGHGVADLAGADDDHALLERGPRPDRRPADPARRAGRQDRHDPVGDQRDDRRLGPEREHEDDEQHPARRRQRGEAGQTLAEVEAADAARRLAVQAVDPERREQVGRQQDEAARGPPAGSLSNAPLSCWSSGRSSNARRRPRPRGPTPPAARRRPPTPWRRRAARTAGASSRRPSPDAAALETRRAPLFDRPVGHVSYIGNTFRKHKRRSRARNGVALR